MYEEQTLEEEEIFSGRVVKLSKLTVKLPNGRTSTREVIVHPGAVAVLAEPEPDRVILVKQFRKACETELWEIPAGKLEPNEDPDAAAKRELSEETGFSAERMERLFTFYTSPGFANEKLHVYYASELKEGEIHLDEDEFVETRLFNRQEIDRMLQMGGIEDAKTLVALLWWCGRNR
ncbi:NUDIX hydrolase [Alicyclobacillus dauci]|uniref:NUDIX hydrolase n=1 Tax=Alicyclobacillus dauci TaxID=1475485 RepID=A0ABY6Z9W6_9BACL|nr:NUDIX hydrolase [Alicyclobacillus dauci]WAH39051.1 NUDIX hydrolase [Alicyclobacillus dauci]